MPAVFVHGVPETPAVWDGVPRLILIQAVDSIPLLGMLLLTGYDLQARVLIGGAVQIDAVP